MMFVNNSTTLSGLVIKEQKYRDPAYPIINTIKKKWDQTQI